MEQGAPRVAVQAAQQQATSAGENFSAKTGRKRKLATEAAPEAAPESPLVEVRAASSGARVSHLERAARPFARLLEVTGARASAADVATRQASRLVDVLKEATEKLRQPEASFNELRLTLRRTAHALAELAKDGAWPGWRRGGRVARLVAETETACWSDDKVDDVVEAGAVEVVVPLLMLRAELPFSRDGAAAPRHVSQTG